jgi:hypothetical protein
MLDTTLDAALTGVAGSVIFCIVFLGAWALDINRRLKILERKAEGATNGR